MNSSFLRTCHKNKASKNLPVRGVESLLSFQFSILLIFICFLFGVFLLLKKLFVNLLWEEAPAGVVEHVHSELFHFPEELDVGSVDADDVSDFPDYGQVFQPLCEDNHLKKRYSYRWEVL